MTFILLKTFVFGTDQLIIGSLSFTHVLKLFFWEFTIYVLAKTLSLYKRHLKELKYELWTGIDLHDHSWPEWSRTPWRIIASETISSLCKLASGRDDFDVPLARSIRPFKRAVDASQKHERSFASYSTILKEHHSYECPCLLALPILGGNPSFLDWIKEETHHSLQPDIVLDIWTG